MRIPAEVLIAGVLLAMSAACHKAPSGEATGGASVAADAGAFRVVETEASTPLANAPRIAPPRCRPADSAMALGPDGAAADLELGDAIEAPPGYAVSLLHRTARGLEAAVGLLSGGAGGPKGPAAVIDLGPTLGDAPPPRMLLAGGDLLAAAYSIADAAVPNSSANGANAKTRRLSLYEVPLEPGRGAPKPIFDVPQERDDSLAFDLALVGPEHAPPSGPALRRSAVVVWDEASRAGHGVIRATTVSLADRMSASSGASAAASESSMHDVSPSDSDAEVPRVVSYGSGALALWIARKLEPGVPTDAAEVEATGEARSFGWLESVMLDEHGAPAGPVRKLTAPSGHVSAYDVRILPAAKKPTLLVVARDDGEAVDASGGELLRVRIVGDAVEPPVAFPSDGLGRGGPALVDGDPSWLVWIGPHEQLRLLPLDAEGAPLGKPSAEDEMSEARPLLFLRGAPSVGARAAGAPNAPNAPNALSALVASPLDPAAPLRVFGCAL